MTENEDKVNEPSEISGRYFGGTGICRSYSMTILCDYPLCKDNKVCGRCITYESV